jgi:hypothetical protein
MGPLSQTGRTVFAILKRLWVNLASLAGFSCWLIGRFSIELLLDLFQPFPDRPRALADIFAAWALGHPGRSPFSLPG